MASKKPYTRPDAQELDAVFKSIEKDFGAGSIMRLGDGGLEMPDTFPTGSIALDEALGIGGFPRGRVIEIYGPESSGKTSLALHATGNAQKQGLLTAFIDAEHALDPEWAETLGVATDDLIISQPNSGEQALKIAARLVNSGKIGVITIDSVAALVPEAELNGEIGDSHIGLQARMMSQGLRMLAGPCSATNTTIIFINQLREKTGVFFGNSETQPGGKALKFYSSVRLDVRRIQTLKHGDSAIGSRVKVKVVKNKCAPPFKIAEFDFMFGQGINHERELIDLAVERKVVRKSGAFYSMVHADLPETLSLGQGKDASQRYLADHPDVSALIEEAVRGSAHVVPVPTERGNLMAGAEDSPWDGDESSPDE